MTAQAEKPRDLIVIGASAGGVETLRQVVAGFPSDLHAAVCVVLHIAPTSPSALARILERAGKLPCRTAVDGMPLRAGEIVVAPPDRHLEIDDEHVRLTAGPRENGHRPAVDVLFRSAAAARDGRVIGVILSGTRDDGTAGLAVIKSGGGGAVVQDPADAMYPGMPRNALANVAVDAVVPSRLVAETLIAMVNGQQPAAGAVSGHVPAGPAASASSSRVDPDNPDTTICPECGGVLTVHSETGVTQWRCRVGHQYSPDSLLNAQAQGVEAGLWAAVRALGDRRIVLQRLADRLDVHEGSRSAARLRQRAAEAALQEQAVREVLTHAVVSSLNELGHELSTTNDEQIPGESIEENERST